MIVFSNSGEEPLPQYLFIPENKMSDRIVSNPNILSGKPIIRGNRISMELIQELSTSGANCSDIIDVYPHLTDDDVQAALHYANRCYPTLNNNE